MSTYTMSTVPLTMAAVPMYMRVRTDASSKNLLKAKLLTNCTASY